ncbi:hypothetical protein CSUI_008324, partial [Cystoisospora suis]
MVSPSFLSRRLLSPSTGRLSPSCCSPSGSTGRGTSEEGLLLFSPSSLPSSPAFFAPLFNDIHQKRSFSLLSIPGRSPKAFSPMSSSCRMSRGTSLHVAGLARTSYLSLGKRDERRIPSFASYRQAREKKQEVDMCETSFERRRELPLSPLIRRAVRYSNDPRLSCTAKAFIVPTSSPFSKDSQNSFNTSGGTADQAFSSVFSFRGILTRRSTDRKEKTAPVSDASLCIYSSSL